MPASNEKKITAAFTLTACIVLMEFLYHDNQQEKAYKMPETGSPHTMVFAELLDALIEMSHAMPLEVILILKLFLPSLLLLQLWNSEDEQIARRNSNSFFTPDEFNPHLKAYLARQRAKQSQRTPYQTQLDQLRLTTEEQDKLTPYIDPITYNVIELPVQLYNNTYDLDTLLNLDPSKDPATTLPFSLRDIQAHPKIAEEIENLFKEFHQARESALPLFH